MHLGGCDSGPHVLPYIYSALLLEPDLQGWGARPYAGLSLLKGYGKFNTNSNGADTVYICKHSACLHTQKCAHNVVTQITLKFHSE